MCRTRRGIAAVTITVLTTLAVVEAQPTHFPPDEERPPASATSPAAAADTPEDVILVPTCHGSLPVPKTALQAIVPRDSALTTADQTEPAPHSVIDIAIFYTSQLRIELGGTTQVKEEIDRLIEFSNYVYRIQGVHQSLNLVAAKEVQYTETDVNTDLNRFHRKQDGYLDRVHIIRERTQADVLMLLRSTPTGIAFVNTGLYDRNRLENSAQLAFGVSNRSTVTFLHELGHIMGLEHDRYDAGCEGRSTCQNVAAYHYGHGYVNLRGLASGAPESTRWGTIMTTNKLCGDSRIYCRRISFFSSPRLLYPRDGGDPMGIESTSTATGRDGPADAAKALENVRTLVADFRTGERRLGRIDSLENPAPHSPQSGIGLVGGWACEATEVMIEFALDDGRIVSLPAAVGTLRGDTASICGHADTGFGLLFNWNILGDGTHTVRAFADGVLVDAHHITVTTLGLGDFPRDLQGAYTVQDFPRVGQQTALEWNQARQNFVITAARTATEAPGQTRDPRVGVLENPGPGSLHSGIEVVSGWHCQAEAITIEFTNGTTGQVIRTQAGAGTARADTAGVCGRSATGFGLLWNWNLLGDGWHTVRAFADDETEPFAWSRVFVTTLGEEFAQGLSGDYELANFPAPGQSVTVEWRQEQQNFVITAVQ